MGTAGGEFQGGIGMYFVVPLDSMDVLPIIYDLGFVRSHTRTDGLCKIRLSAKYLAAASSIT
jgi:hypothetical protein